MIRIIKFYGYLMVWVSSTVSRKTLNVRNENPAVYKPYNIVKGWLCNVKGIVKTLVRL